MSWGFLADLQLTLPPRTWTTLQGKTPVDYPLSVDWTGFTERSLATAFAPPGTQTHKPRFRTILAWPVFRKECLRVEKRRGGRVHVRVALFLDRSELDVAGYLGALLEGVRVLDGEGSLSLVNDGSYVGEAGRVLVVRAGKRSARAVKKPHALIEEVGALLHPDAFDEEEDDEIASAPSRPDPDRAHGTAFALYKDGDIAGARNCLAGYFDGGGVARADLVTNYTAFLRAAPPRGKAMQAAHETVLGAFRDDPSLLANVPLLENAVAFLNENGRAKDSVELVLAANKRKTPWSSALACNVTYSAGVAKQAALTDQLLAILRPVLDATPAMFAADAAQLMHNIATLHVQRRRNAEAFAALTRSLELAPDRRAEIVGDKDLAPLHADARWATLVGKPRRRQ
jgi:hypothetical protein